MAQVGLHLDAPGEALDLS